MKSVKVAAANDIKRVHKGKESKLQYIKSLISNTR